MKRHWITKREWLYPPESSEASSKEGAGTPPRRYRTRCSFGSDSIRRERAASMAAGRRHTIHAVAERLPTAPNFGRKGEMGSQGLRYFLESAFVGVPIRSAQILRKSEEIP